MLEEEEGDNHVNGDNAADAGGAGGVPTGCVETLEVENFKSYRGRHTLGPFRAFQAVIGLNGAGKTNVIDALCFVLGARASLLRGKQLKDLVYHSGPSGGSDDASAEEGMRDSTAPPSSPQPRCRVALVFRRYEDDLQMVFERAITVTGSGAASVFSIDGKSVTEAEYAAELRRLNIVVKARNFLVSQGDVGSVAGKNGVELARFFETISGSEELIGEYEEARAAKEKAEESTMFAFSKKKGLGAEKRQYKAMKDEADHFQELSQRRDEIALNLVMCQLRNVVRGVDRLKDSVDKLRTRNASVGDTIAASEEQMAAVRTEVAELARRDAELRADARREQGAADQTAADTIRARETAAHAESAARRLSAQLESLDKEFQARAAAAAALQERLAEAEREKAAFEEARAREDAGRVELSAEQLREFQDVQARANALAGPLRAELEREQRQCVQSETKDGATSRTLEQLSTREQQLSDIRTKQQQRYDRAAEQQKAIEASLQQNTAQIAEHERQGAADTARRTELEAELATVERELGGMRMSRREEEREARLRTLLASLRAAFPLVRGRLADICKPVKSRYNLAVTVAMGKYMDAIVVDNDETAMECIKYMKEQHLGVATFLPLASLDVKPVRESYRQLGPGTRLALDIISCSDECQRALQFAVGNTVVTDTLEDARRISFGDRGHHHRSHSSHSGHRDAAGSSSSPSSSSGRIRVVTVDGVLIEKSGLMTGGLSGLEQRASRWSERSITALKERKAALQQELDDIARRSHRQASRDELRARVDADSERMRYCTTELGVLGEKLAVLDKDLAMVRAERERVAGEHAENARAIRASQERMAQLSGAVDAQVASLYEDFGRRIGVEHVDQLEESRLQRAREANERRLALEAAAAKLRSELVFEQSRDLEGPRRRLEASLADARAKLAAAEQAQQQCRQAAEATAARLGAIEAEQKGVRQQIAAGDARLGELKRAIAGDTETARGLQKQITALDAQLYKLRSRRHDIIQRARVDQIDLPLLAVGPGPAPRFLGGGGGGGGGADDPTQSQSQAQAQALSLSQSFSQSFSQSDGLDGLMTDDVGSQIQTQAQTQAAMDRDEELRFDFGALDRNLSLRADTGEQYERVVATLTEQLGRLTEELSRIAPNLKATDQLAGVVERLERETEAFEAARAASRAATERFARVRKERTARFLRAFEAVAGIIDETYKQLTRTPASPVGGTASLDLESDDEPYLHGIKYTAVPPMKRFHELEQLSGGERTMAALALLFAVQRHQPAPFVVLDEIDAPLDPANRAQVARYLRAASRPRTDTAAPGTQCIVVSHNLAFYEKADALLGIARDSARQSSVAFTLDLSDYE